MLTPKYFSEMVKKKALDLGKHFSAHVHGMFLHPKATIRSVIKEPIEVKDLWVPTAIVLVASVMTSLGKHIWNIAFEPSILISIGRTIQFILLDLLPRPFWLIFVVWIPSALVFHFLGSIVSGKDITDWQKMHKTFKLAGISMVPAFLNSLPYFFMFTGYWIWILTFWSMKENYDTTDGGSLIITAPFLIGTVFMTLYRLNIL